MQVGLSKALKNRVSTVPEARGLGHLPAPLYVCYKNNILTGRTLCRTSRVPNLISHRVHSKSVDQTVSKKVFTSENTRTLRFTIPFYLGPLSVNEFNVINVLILFPFYFDLSHVTLF